MRRILVGAATCAGLVVASPSAAQAPISMGPLVGLNFADISGDDFADEFGDTNSRLGFAIGGFAEFGLSDLVSLRPELVYTQKGTEVEAGGVEAKVKLDNVQLPVLAKLMFGAAAMIDLDCEDIGADTKGFEVAGIAGLGVDVDRFTFDVRFDKGFSGIFDVDEVDAKNQTISARAGYAFGLR